MTVYIDLVCIINFIYDFLILLTVLDIFKMVQNPKEIEKFIIIFCLP